MQAQLTENRTGTKRIRAAGHRSLLAGKLFDDRGHPLVASHASKGAQRYRYYVSRDLQHGMTNEEGFRIPALEIERLVISRVANWLEDPLGVIDRLGVEAPSPDKTQKLITICWNLVRDLPGSDQSVLTELISSLVSKIDITRDSVAIVLDDKSIAARLLIDAPPIDAPPFSINIPATLKRSGSALRMVLPSGETPSPKVDDKLLTTIATAKQWWQQMQADPQLRVTDLAMMHQVTESWVSRVLRLAFLDPAIVTQLISGTAPAALDFEALRGTESVPALWSAQRDLHQVSLPH